MAITIKESNSWSILRIAQEFQHIFRDFRRRMELIAKMNSREARRKSRGSGGGVNSRSNSSSSTDKQAQQKLLQSKELLDSWEKCYFVNKSCQLMEC